MWQSNRGNRLLALIGALVLCLTYAGRALAGPCDTISISGMDVTTFPIIEVSAGCLPAGVAELGADAFEVLENQIPQPVSSVNVYEAPLQLALVLDMAGTVDAPGASGQPIRDEYRLVVEDFTLTDKSLDRMNRTDQVMLTVPDGTTASQSPIPWTNDYNNLTNKVREHITITPPARTALKSMLIETLAQMNDLANWQGNALAIVVVSDGVDTTSVEDITDVINRATAINVRLHTIKVGPNNKGDASSLQRMARMTGGVYAAYTGTGSLDAMQMNLREAKQRLRLSYRSGVSQQGNHGSALQATVQGRSYTSQEFRWSISLQPPAVAITQPATGQTIKRVAASWEANPREVEPTELGVGIRVDFPDGRPRTLRRLTLLVNGVAQPLDMSRPIWSLADTQRGEWAYSLVVQAEDELGMVGESQPVNVTVDLQLVDPPACLPGDLLCHAKNNANWLAIGVLSIALVVVALTKRREVAQAASSIGRFVKDTIAAQGGKSRRPLAFLVTTDAAGNRLESYAITNPKTTIGRDRQMATLVLEDETISKYHAQLLQNRDAGFLLNDEGSSNGTYVNDERLYFEPKELHEGDVIYFGQLRVVFRLAGDEEDPIPAMAPGRYATDRTQPMMPQAPYRPDAPSAARGAPADGYPPPPPGGGHYNANETQRYANQPDRDQAARR